jgi:hypothetical protein
MGIRPVAITQALIIADSQPQRQAARTDFIEEKTIRLADF